MTDSHLHVPQVVPGNTKDQQPQIVAWEFVRSSMEVFRNWLDKVVMALLQAAGQPR